MSRRHVLAQSRRLKQRARSVGWQGKGRHSRIAGRRLLFLSMPTCLLSFCSAPASSALLVTVICCGSNVAQAHWASGLHRVREAATMHWTSCLPPVTLYSQFRVQHFANAIRAMPKALCICIMVNANRNAHVKSFGDGTCSAKGADAIRALKMALMAFAPLALHVGPGHPNNADTHAREHARVHSRTHIHTQTVRLSGGH